MHKIIKIIVFVAIVVVLLVFGSRVLAPEDNWICQDGAWQKHGSPSEPMPETKCE